MRVQILISFVALIALVSAHPDWNAFKAKYNRKYEDVQEESLRKGIFLKNKHKVERFNKFESHRAGYRLGINHLSDWTPEELSRLNGARKPEVELKNTPEAEAFFETVINRPVDVPDSLDWRKVKGRVSKVEFQGGCGSCWAFSAIGALEGQMEVRNTSLNSLSAQNLVDCSKQNGGCAGGWMLLAWSDIAEEGGIESKHDYEYRGQDGNCSFDKSKAIFNDKSAYVLNTGDEEQLKQTVAKFGPVSVAIDADPWSFASYKSGVYYDKDCKDDNPVHAVLVVGYGTDSSGNQYWVVKNSWSEDWGLNGYILMARNRNNHCGIASHAMIPTFSS